MYLKEQDFLYSTAFALCLKELYEENVDAGDYLFLNFNEKAFNNLQQTVLFSIILQE